MIYPCNCLIAAIIVSFFTGGRIKRTKFGLHFYVKTPDRKLYHFSEKKNFIPSPFHLIVSIGKIENFRSN